MARYLVSVPHPYSVKVGGKGKRPVQVNIEASSTTSAKEKLMDFGIPWQPISSWSAGETSKYTKDSGIKLESIDPQTGSVKGGRAVGANQSTGGKTIPKGGSPGVTGNTKKSQPESIEADGSSGGGAGTTTGDQRDLIEQLTAIGKMEPKVISDVRRRIGDGTAVDDEGNPIRGGVGDNEFSQKLFDDHVGAGNTRYDDKYDNDPRNTIDTDPYGDGSDYGGAGGAAGGGGASGSGDRGDGGKADKTFKTAAELALMYPDVPMNARQQKIIDGILNGEYTPDELAGILDDPEFQAIFNTALGPILNPALQLAVTNATEQLKVSGAITQADAGATTAGAILRSGGDVDDILKGVRVGVTGLSSDELVTESQRISSSGGFSDVKDMLTQQRIQASGGLDTNADILAIQQAEAADNAFGSLQLGDAPDSEAGSRMANILSIIEAQNSGASGANAVAREQNFMNFIRSPEAVGAATAMGFDIQTLFKDIEAGGTGGVEAVDEVAEMTKAIENEANAPVGAVSSETAKKALDLQDPNSGFNNETRDGVGSFAGFGPYNYQETGMNTPVNGSSATSSTVSGQAQPTPNFGASAVSRTGLGATSGVGALRGLSQNFTEGQYDNRSNAEQGNIRGQLAARQGLGEDQVQERARSYTPGDTSTKRQLV